MHIVWITYCKEFTEDSPLLDESNELKHHAPTRQSEGLRFEAVKA